MKCESCKKNEATIHLTQVVGGTIRKMHFCEGCARKEGVALEIPSSISDLLVHPASTLKAPEQKPVATCPQCGMTHMEFKKRGRLGCAKCYDAFGDKLLALITSMHHAEQHHGKIPSQKRPVVDPREELKALKDALKKAIAVENFEDAAILRDKIRQRTEEIKAEKAAPNHEL